MATKNFSLHDPISVDRAKLQGRPEVILQRVVDCHVDLSLNLPKKVHVSHNSLSAVMRELCSIEDLKFTRLHKLTTNNGLAPVEDGRGWNRAVGRLEGSVANAERRSGYEVENAELLSKEFLPKLRGCCIGADRQKRNLSPAMLLEMLESSLE